MAHNYIPLVEPATENDLETISEDMKLGVGGEDMEDYLEWVNETLNHFNKIKNIEEETIPVLYPRIPGVKLPADQNRYNAWATKMVIKGEQSGKLAGKKIAIKDNIFVAGTPLQNGSKIWDGYTPEFDATAVTRILQEGGTILGKSTCENQCFSGNSFTSLSGPVPNPHDTSRSSGGSSSGSAVLIVTGEVDMALGGDQGGSVRMPCSWSGCVGLKPTWGIVPVTGSLGMMPAFDHIGPMAANVTDAALLLEVIAGYDDGRDHRQRPDLVVPQYSQMLKGDLNGMRLGYVKEGFRKVTTGVKSVVDDVVSKMREAGAIVDEISIPMHLDGAVVFAVLAVSEYENMLVYNGQASGYNEFYQVSAAKHMNMSLKTQAHDLQPLIKAWTFVGEHVRRKDGGQIVARAMNMRSTVRKAYDKQLEIYDALIMPTINYVAPKLPKLDMTVKEFAKAACGNLHNTQMFNLTGHPSLSINVGKTLPEDDGTKELPVGLMISGKHFEDSKVLDIGFGIEKLLQQA